MEINIAVVGVISRLSLVELYYIGQQIADTHLMTYMYMNVYKRFLCPNNVCRY